MKQRSFIPQNEFSLVRFVSFVYFWALPTSNGGLIMMRFEEKSEIDLIGALSHLTHVDEDFDSTDLTNDLSRKK